MKLLEFNCIKSKDEEVLGNTEYFVLFECDEERTCYEWTHRNMHNDKIADECQAYYAGYWDCYITERLDQDMGESDVWYYMNNETQEDVPKIGGTFALDDTVWERVA